MQVDRVQKVLDQLAVERAVRQGRRCTRVAYIDLGQGRVLPFPHYSGSVMPRHRGMTAAGFLQVKSEHSDLR